MYCETYLVGWPGKRRKVLSLKCQSSSLHLRGFRYSFMHILPTLSCNLWVIFLISLKLKHYYNIPWSALRVLALCTGTTHVLFQRERDGFLEMIDVAEHVITCHKPKTNTKTKFTILTYWKIAPVPSPDENE